MPSLMFKDFRLRIVGLDSSCNAASRRKITSQNNVKMSPRHVRVR